METMNLILKCMLFLILASAFVLTLGEQNPGDRIAFVMLTIGAMIASILAMVHL